MWSKILSFFRAFQGYQPITEADSHSRAQFFFSRLRAAGTKFHNASDGHSRHDKENVNDLFGFLGKHPGNYARIHLLPFRKGFEHI